MIKILGWQKIYFFIMNFQYDSKGISTVISHLKVRKDFTLHLAEAKKMRVDYVYNTAALEGNPMTYPEVQTLLDGVTVGGHKLEDEHQVLNQNESWKLLIKLIETKQFHIDKKTFCKLHEKVSYKESLEWGVFRTSNVLIGGTEYKPPKFKDLESIFQSGINGIQKIDNVLLQALCFFLFGSLNQFFFDGNKRTSRLMMNGILLKNGCPILNIQAKNRLEFNKKMIQFYDTQDATKILEYLIKYYGS